MPALCRAIVALATSFTWRSTRFGARFRADPFTQRQKTQDANDHCFFNLRWNFVCQRSQHLLSRLARHYQVVFVEEPVPNGDDFLEHLSPAPNVEVLRPPVTSNLPGFHDDHLSVLQNQLAAFMREREIDDYLIWFYTPMALPLANGLKPRAVIYDCMDELSGFMCAPRQPIWC